MAHTSKLLLENGSDRLLLEDGTSFLLLEGAHAGFFSLGLLELGGIAVPDPNPALTGVTATGHPGTLASVTTSVGLTSGGATGSPGTATPNLTLALTAAGATGSVGTLGPVTSLALTASGATGGVGTVTAGSDLFLALSGVEATASVGAVSPSTAVVLVADPAVGELGDVVPDSIAGGFRSLALFELGIARNAGVVVALTGVSATTSSGFARPGTAAATSGVFGSGAIGNIVPANVVTASFRSLALIELGGVSHQRGVTVQLTGVQAVGEVSGLFLDKVPEPSLDLRGKRVNRPGYGPYSVGRMFRSRAERIYSTQISIQQGLTGVQASAVIGSVVQSRTIALTGVAATGTPGSVGLNQGAGFFSLAQLEMGGLTGVGTSVTLQLTGVSATGEVGVVQQERLPVSTLELRGSRRNRPGFGPYSTGRYFRPRPYVAFDGSGVEVSVGLTGVVAVGEVGDVRASSIIGVQGAGGAGVLVPEVTVALTGVEGTGSVGVPIAAPNIPLTAEPATGQVGNVGIAGDVTVALTGVGGAGQIGSFVGEIAPVLSGNAATGEVASVGLTVRAFLTSVMAIAQAGSVVAVGGDRWRHIDDFQPPGWSNRPKGPPPPWAEVDDTETPDWS